MSWKVVVTLVALGCAALARGDDATDLRRLFPEQADVIVAPPGGLVRLDLPPAVVGACRADLSDLRVFDRAGHEVPYLIDAGLAPGASFETKTAVDATPLDVRREETRPERSPPRHRETYVLGAPTTAPETGAWDLVVTTGRAAFARRVDVSVARADGTSAPLVENGSLFRLTGPPREKLRLPLPPFSGERLTVTIEGQDGFYLEPTFRFESTRTTPGREQAVVPLAEVEREHAPERTIVELERPRGLVPGTLRVATATPWFSRPVTVWDEGQGMPAVRIGQGAVFRLEAAAAVEERDVPLVPARGERLRVEIADGDSPGLERLEFAAVVSRPGLILSLVSDGRDVPAATLYFGGGRAYAPRYDLAAFAPLLSGTSEGARAVAAQRLRDLDRAELGPVRDSVASDAAPVLAFALRPGAEVDARLFSHRRRLQVTPSAEGLSRLTLAAEDVARARPDLGDVRIIDGASRQWSYLLERDATREWRELGATRTARRRHVSRYQLTLPARPLRLDRLRLETDAPFFDRAYRLLSADGDRDERVLAQGRLVRRAGRAAETAIGFPLTAVESLALEIDDGDDAPLELRAVRAQVVLPDVFLAAPAGDYTVLLGNPDATAPSYELERVRDVVLAVRSEPAVAGEAGPNPAYTARARLTSGEGAERVLPRVILWAVLLAAVGVLTVITLRLARREPGAGDAS